tara:strand:+ start:1870 stop:3096 length:1227 start_codon:yes stop_codon:yes gene_type:complete
MKFGVLADLFEGAGAKYLTGNELKRQHEFQGVRDFRKLLGEPAEKKTFDAEYYWLTDDEDCEPQRVSSYCTWGDVRRDNPLRAPEFHLYYARDAEPVVHAAKAGDLVLIALTKQGGLVVVLCPAGSTISQQMLWLFGLAPETDRADVKTLGVNEGISLGFAARAVLEALGIQLEEPEPDAFGQLLQRYGMHFPATAVFSEFARSTCEDANPVEAPDEALVSWMDHEEALFRYLEKQIVAERLEQGFMLAKGPDVDGFIGFSLSVQNRRKSRAGWAFGHHVAAVLDAHELRYKREATTEKRNGPDFLFPGESAYHDKDFDVSLLSMLAAKTSCKDRWRQVLAEANRIGEKHLLTLQPGISLAQTSEMQAERLQLVVPRPIFSSYLEDQQAWLLDVSDFLALVKDRQARC